jgi:hypothetical protein
VGFFFSVSQFDADYAFVPDEVEIFNIVISKLPRDVTEQTVRSLLQICGLAPVGSLRVVCPPSGIPGATAYAAVTFRQPQHARRALVTVLRESASFPGIEVKLDPFGA